MKKKLVVLVGALTISTAVGLGLSQSDQAASASENQEPTLSSDDITSIVKEQYEGKITDFELDRDNNQSHYEVEVIHDDEEYDLEIDAETGEIIKENVEKFQLENKQEATKNSNFDSSNFIGDQKAKEIALKQFSGKVVGFELDEDDDKYVYEIEVREGNKEADFEIDAVTGDILEMDTEIDDDRFDD
ncbi:PepSY domain-containing protein [Oceanobacillus kimchii]|uniref:PepSY domain-containing protein n=1 Tax=Oceanobacillus kimchii TaxID=746691 RepID=UPI00034C804C|nr:PepSY domain-containing protein [Oceanobacillus kimchii]